MRKIITTILVLLLIVASIPAAAVNLEDAPDEEHWVYDNFITLYEIGLLQGYPDYTFRGDNEATRYELVELSARVLKNLQERVEELEGELEGLNYLSPNQIEELYADEIEGEVEELYAFIQQLESEFASDIEDQNVKVTTLAERVEGIEADIDELGDVQQDHDQRIEEALSTARQGRLFGIIGILFGVAGLLIN